MGLGYRIRVARSSPILGAAPAEAGRRLLRSLSRTALACSERIRLATDVGLSKACLGLLSCEASCVALWCGGAVLASPWYRTECTTTRGVWCATAFALLGCRRRTPLFGSPSLQRMFCCMASLRFCRCDLTFSRGPSLGFQAPRAADPEADRPSTGEVAVGPVVAGPTVPGAVSNADGRRLRSSSSWVASTVGARSTNFAVWTSESKAASSAGPSSLRGPVVLRGLGGARSSASIAMSVVVTGVETDAEEVESEPLSHRSGKSRQAGHRRTITT